MIYDGTGMKNRKGPLLDPALADKHCSVTNGQADEPEPQQQNSGTNSGTSAHDNISQCQTVSNSVKQCQTISDNVKWPQPPPGIANIWYEGFLFWRCCRAFGTQCYKLLLCHGRNALEAMYFSSDAFASQQVFLQEFQAYPETPHRSSKVIILQHRMRTQVARNAQEAAIQLARLMLNEESCEQSKIRWKTLRKQDETAWLHQAERYTKYALTFGRKASELQAMMFLRPLKDAESIKKSWQLISRKACCQRWNQRFVCIYSWFLSIFHMIWNSMLKPHKCFPD